MRQFSLAILSLTLACDTATADAPKPEPKSAAASPTAKEAPPTKPAPAAETPAKPKPDAPQEPPADALTLEDTPVEGFGTLKLPKGAKQMTLNDQLAYYSWRADGKSITAKVARTGGRTSLKAAKKWAGLDAGKAEVTAATEVEKGVFEVELQRASDGTNFVVRFDKAGRMSCMGTGGVEMAVLKEVCASYPT